MKSKAHIKEILLYLLAWLVVPLLLVALAEFGFSYYGLESVTTSRILLVIRCAVYLHLFLHPIPREYDKRERYTTIGIRDLVPGLLSRNQGGQKEEDETDEVEDDASNDKEA